MGGSTLGVGDVETPWRGRWWPCSATWPFLRVGGRAPVTRTPQDPVAGDPQDRPGLCSRQSMATDFLGSTNTEDICLAPILAWHSSERVNNRAGIRNSVTWSSSSVQRDKTHPRAPWAAVLKDQPGKTPIVNPTKHGRPRPTNKGGSKHESADKHKKACAGRNDHRGS